MPRIAQSNKPRLPAPQSKVSSVIPVPAAAPTLGQSMKDGFGLGIGSAIAHRVVSGIFGAPTVNTVAAPPREPTAFEQCVAEHRDDIALCAHLAEKKSGK